MKTVVFSDTHANYAAMKAIFDQEKQFDRVIFLGDAILFGPEPEETVTALREMDACCLMGNHDEELFYLDSITEMDHPEHLDWLRWTRDRLTDLRYQGLLGPQGGGLPLAGCRQAASEQYVGGRGIAGG